MKRPRQNHTAIYKVRVFGLMDGTERKFDTLDVRDPMWRILGPGNSRAIYTYSGYGCLAASSSWVGSTTNPKVV